MYGNDFTPPGQAETIRVFYRDVIGLPGQRQIEQHVAWTVQDLVDHLSVSRSWLERNFRKMLNRSPQAEPRRPRRDHRGRTLWWRL